MAIVEFLLWLLLLAYWLWRFAKLICTLRPNHWPARAFYFESIMLIVLVTYGLQVVPGACTAIGWCP